MAIKTPWATGSRASILSPHRYRACRSLFERSTTVRIASRLFRVLRLFIGKFCPPLTNKVPLVCTAILMAMAFVWGWLSDALRGTRWPFIYLGAIIHVGFAIAFLRMPLYDDIEKRKLVYWFSEIGGGAGPLIIIWISEICSADTEKRALLVAVADDLAYVLQAIAPNFVWRTTDFPAATRGYVWSIVLQVLMAAVTIAIQFLLTRDRRREKRKTSVKRTRTVSWALERQPLVSIDPLARDDPV